VHAGKVIVQDLSDNDTSPQREDTRLVMIITIDKFADFPDKVFCEEVY